MFYLTIHSTHFIYGYMIWDRNSETHCHHFKSRLAENDSIDRIVYTMTFVTPAVEHWLE